MKNQTCHKCSIVYAIPDAMYKAALEDGRAFYCPNGHSEVFTETEIDELKKELDIMRRAFGRESSSNIAKIYRIEHLEKSNAALRGVITKMRNKAMGAGL